MLTAKELDPYSGNYKVAGDEKDTFKVYLSGGKLYFKQNDQLSQEFAPYAKDSFFMYEDEKADINFKTEGDKKYFVFNFPGEKPVRLDRVN